MQQPQERPAIPSIQKEIGTKEIEAFQNTTLRPIIKQLHALLLAHFSSLLLKRKGHYFKIADDQKGGYIHSIFQTEQLYKSELKGMIIGNFTSNEYQTYRRISTLIDKRIYSIVEERISTNQSELIDLRT
ncbi:hypothetical protein SAMN05661096_01614 [Marivirga sericea]|uniref:Uncharacterized protein n=1 Tax=Marivirga sericea TaxID=1028 RepID=A0A1X7JIW9_9BACT|nr:hypothetical protein [Marivirga sericea]SMG27504.1 hypothetical protein SAMN05661096_01614 [Marivirga sericea]